MGLANSIKKQIYSSKPHRKELRNLGLMFCGALFVVAVLAWLKDRSSWPWWTAGGVLFAAWGLLWPATLWPLHKAWMGLAAVLGYVSMRIVLTSIFYLMITPIGIFLRLSGKDFMDRKRGNEDSYWHIRSDEEYRPRHTEKMY